jgi:hypothetical protein
MKLQLKKGSADVTVLIFVQDSSSTTGAGLTGLVYDSSGLACYYARPGAVAAALTLATQTVTGAHADGGFAEVDSTNMPGVYRLDFSDAIVASGVNSVIVYLQGASNMAPCVLEIQLTGIDVNDATAAGISRLDAAVSSRSDFDEATDDVSVAVGGIGATAFAAGAVDAAALAQDAAREIADEFLNRNLAGGGSGNTRNVRNALRILRNRAAIAGGTLTVYQEDDSSSAWTAVVTTAAGNPISEVDPA